MYRKEPSVPLRSSSSALYNNLCVLRAGERPRSCFGAVHEASLCLVTSDGSGFTHRQLPAKEGSSGLGMALLTQVRAGREGYRDPGVVGSVDMLEGLTLEEELEGAPWCLPSLHWCPGNCCRSWLTLGLLSAQAVFARGIAAAAGSFICVGTSFGSVLVFDIPPKGTNITVSEVLEQHHEAITDIAAELGQSPDGAGDVVTADDAGTLCVWRAGEEFTLLGKIPALGCSCSSVKLWNGIVAAGYGNGQIRLYEAATGVLCAEVNAHARWIYALDLAPHTGKLLSGAEDSFVHVWKLSRDPDTDEVEIQHCHAECVTDTQVCGVRFCDPEGSSFAVTGYDLSEIFRYGK
ncbi:WDR54 protein, partial [Bucco capensis]|nr:WDR54 protein [Bucco capensis]